MKIEQLKLENFKCFKTEKTFDFGRLTILTGANSSGKSTVMQAILSALQSEGFPLSYSPNGEYVNLGDFNEMTHQNNSNPVKLQFTIADKSEAYPFDQVTFTTTWIEDKSNFLPVLKSFYAENAVIDTKIEIEKQKGALYKFKITFPTIEQTVQCFDTIKYRAYAEKYGIELSINALSITILTTIEQFFHFYSQIIDMIDDEDGEANLIRTIDICEFAEHHFKVAKSEMNHIGAARHPPSRIYWAQNKSQFKVGQNGEGYIDQIAEWEKRSKPAIKRLSEIMKQLQLIESVKIKRSEGGRFEVQVKPINGHLTSLSNVGFGVSQFLPILVADLQLPNDSTLFLAEPEIHLHPSVQSKFGEYIVNQINTSDKNYVIETHSEYLLNRIRLAIVKGELKPSDLKVYFLENTKKDTDVYDIQFTKTGAIQNAPPTFFQTYSVDSMAIALNAFSK
jgi:predicted ATPase